MRILIVGSFAYEVYTPAFLKGFTDLGHEVTAIKYDDYLYKSNLISRIQNRYHIGFNLIKYNHDIITTFRVFQADFVFLYSCYNIWPSTLRKLKKHGAFIITYNNDDPFSKVPSFAHSRFFRGGLRFADINFVYREKNIEDYKNVGANNVYILLPYYLRDKNYKEECPKDIDVVFLGHYENDGRDYYIKALLDNGINVKVYSSYWSRSPIYNQLINAFEPTVTGLEYNHIINRAKVVLVFLSRINADTYTRRNFEIPAAGSLMLSEFTSDLDSLFPSNECAVYFRSQDELVKKCQYLLLHPQECERIARNGLFRLRSLGGSELDRCKQIIDTYLKIRNKE